MRATSVFYNLFIFLIYPAVITTTVLYCFAPLFECDFPLPSKPVTKCYLDRNSARQAELEARQALNGKAPFRLLTIADPQLEGDTSLPNPNDPIFPSIRALSSNFSIASPIEAFHALKDFTIEIAFQDIPKLIQSYRKKLDLLGNDYYLAHIYSLIHWWADPTHVTFLGDLVGSQWISDAEFERRSWRFWNRVFRHGNRVEDHITVGGRRELLGKDPAWSHRFINIVGNHDIGYAGDITHERMNRFEKTYGKVNWDITFELPQNDTTTFANPFQKNLPPALQVVILNSMSLDGPAKVESFQTETYDFLNGRVIPYLRPVEDTKAATVVLTHIPLHKAEGLCKDAPYIAYGETGIREQNQISQAVSESLLSAIFGKSLDANAPMKGRGRNGIILNGHDHEGCNVYHFVNRSSDGPDGTVVATWVAKPWSEASAEFEDANIPGLREVTVRSIMGDFAGSVGFLSAWFDDEADQWRFEYKSCSMGVQHFWWAIHGFDMFVICIFIAWLISFAAEKLEERRALKLLYELEREDVLMKDSLNNLHNSESSSRPVKASGVNFAQTSVRRNVGKFG